MEKEIELLSCPFCGESKFIRFVYRDQRHNASLGDRINYGVFCMEGCGAEINPIYETIELAIKAWNTRHSPSAGLVPSQLEPPDYETPLNRALLINEIHEWYKKWSVRYTGTIKTDIYEMIASFITDTKFGQRQIPNVEEIEKVIEKNKWYIAKKSTAGEQSLRSNNIIAQAIHDLLTNPSTSNLRK